MSKIEQDEFPAHLDNLPDMPKPPVAVDLQICP